MVKVNLRFIPIFILVLFGTGEELIYNINTGWNLISLPCEVEETALEGLFPMLSPAYRYNSESMEYEPIEGMPQRNEGFLLLSPSDTTIALECPASFDTAIETKEFCLGLFIGVLDSAMGYAILPTGEIFISMRSMMDITPIPKRVIAKVDGGEVLWLKAIEGVEGTAICATEEGLFVAGKLRRLSPEIFIMKIVDGYSVWTITLFEPSVNEITHIEPTSDGGVVLLDGNSLFKVNREGKLIYALNLPMDCFGLCETSDGHIVTAGFWVSGLEPPAMSILRIDTDGVLVEAVGIDGFPDKKYTCFSGDTLGNMLAAGYLLSDSTTIFTRLDSDMKPIESMELGFWGIPMTVEVFTNGRMGLAGYSQSDAFIAMISEEGAISANSFGIDYIKSLDREFFQTLAMTDEGITAIGQKYNYGLERHAFLVRAGDEGCCSTPLITDLESFESSSYSVDLSISEFTPKVRDTTLELKSIDGLRIIYHCPK